MRERKITKEEAREFFEDRGEREVKYARHLHQGYQKKNREMHKRLMRDHLETCPSPVRGEGGERASSDDGHLKGTESDPKSKEPFP